MSNSDPSEFELHQKARSLGLLLRQEGSIVSGLNFQVSSSTKGVHAEANGDKFPRQGLPGISGPHSGESTGSHRNQPLLPRAVALPKIPSIKHPLERRPPQIMQREGNATHDPPFSLTSLLMTPRSKTTLDPASFIGKKFKPGPTGNRWSTHSGAVHTTREPEQRPSNNVRLVISPKSKADLRRSPGDFYHRNFPHVHLDRGSVLQPQREISHLPGNKIAAIQGAVSDTIRTTNELFALARSKTDLLAVEQLISRSTDKVKSTRSWAVSNWLDGMTCNPKKLHRRDLTYFVK